MDGPLAQKRTWLHTVVLQLAAATGASLLQLTGSILSKDAKGCGKVVECVRTDNTSLLLAGCVACFF